MDYFIKEMHKHYALFALSNILHKKFIKSHSFADTSFLAKCCDMPSRWYTMSYVPCWRYEEKPHNRGACQGTNYQEEGKNEDLKSGRRLKAISYS